MVTVTNVAPAPTITAPDTAASGESVTFTANANDPGDDTFEYQWDWDDGTGIVITTAAVISHEFTAAGTYTVTLHVSDDDGSTGETRHAVTVSAGAQTEYLIYLPVVLKNQ
jgi:PKD repeat protein